MADSQKYNIVLTTEMGKQINVRISKPNAERLLKQMFPDVQIMADLWEYKMHGTPIYLSKYQCKKILKEIFGQGEVQSVTMKN